jgi:hypothetical protein
MGIVKRQHDAREYVKRMVSPKALNAIIQSDKAFKGVLLNEVEMEAILVSSLLNYVQQRQEPAEATLARIVDIVRKALVRH